MSDMRFRSPVDVHIDDVRAAGERFRCAVESAGMSLPEFARKADVAVALIYRYANGETRPSIDSITKMAAALGMEGVEMYRLFSCPGASAATPNTPGGDGG